MKIYEFYLEGFKPLLHNNIHKIHVPNISQITILTGPNGWGKSSILRELTPYAAVRSDYIKDGKKILYIVHEKSTYVLTSDFSKAGAHSFLKDGQELNVSGTTDVQNDLVNTCFGYSKLLDDLLLGNMKLTAMGRPARRELFMATYPGSLAFVLNHFTRLSSLNRATLSQIKLLREREAKITTKLISSETLKMHMDLKKNLDKMVNQFDQNIYMANNLLKSVLDNKQSVNDDAGEDVEYFKGVLNNISHSYNELINDEHSDIVAKDRLEIILNNTNNLLKTLTDDHKNLITSAMSVKEEIEKYSEYLKVDVDDAIKQCNNIISAQHEIIKHREVDKNIPVMNEDVLGYVKYHLSNVENLIQWLAEFDRDHWDRETYVNKQNEAKQLELRINKLNNEHNNILTQLSMLNSQLRSSGGNSYPKDCDRPCKLRMGVEKMVLKLTSTIEQHTKKRDEIHKELEHLKTVYKALISDLEGRDTADVKISNLERIISVYNWSNYVYNNETLITCLNLNPMGIWNRLIKIIRNSDNNIACKTAKEMLEVTTLKLDNLKSTNMPAKKFITNILVEKEIELNNIHKRLRKVSEQGKLLQERKKGYVKHNGLINAIDKLYDRYTKWMEYKKLEIDEQLLTDIIEDLVTHKTHTHEKLRSIESIITEQQGYLTILNDELKPTISELTEKIRLLTLITEQLSPTSGIPYKYSIQYINDLFRLANKFIKHIWEHEIELTCFKDGDSFDFVFKLLINNSSELKDINMCSKGQKSLIDLVVNLAICIYRGYAQIYPIKLDEIDDGMTPNHQARLTEFLGELLQQNTINQVFIMNHQLSVSSSFENAGVISLSNEDMIPPGCKVISKIN